MTLFMFVEKLKKLPRPSIIQLIFAGILVYMLSNNIKSLLNYRNGLKRLEEKTQAINTLKLENEEIKKKIAKTETEEFLYKSAVDQLNLSKPNEKILILDETGENTPNQPTPNAQQKEPVLQNNFTNFQLWRKAFNL
jgi:cell division protein FtsB